eukprot:6153084-Alexandrium_andersonii.AAC.1
MFPKEVDATEISTLNELVSPFSGWDKSKADDYYLQQACRIFSSYTGALLVHTQENVPVIKLRSTPKLPDWISGCSNFLFVLPLPTESGGYCSGL